ncbi:MAG: bifunctional diaminohydroxyphosphoribosylaminopyrimidine deaminase/5-amino-6-(5-phosphoribosylamino)uracil reductase RibD [Lachnospiraceae bacterium]|nr:bifunctional diaminohydroxyphosphoribosylaminopyrimidine deaminase/5-amino-6-(5-phosphoribosylamino)uracil reductase RibD [Lachnospiraceae bacterium]
MEKEDYMSRALELAKKGAGHTNPNPMVGCVVVKDGRVIGEGWHEEYGGFHAERNALLHCEEDPAGADLYVTLEPCCHTGKTPPCTDIILEKGIGRVFVGSLDPNPLVNGRGIQILRDAGIPVETGILAEECEHINEVFYHYISTKRPFLVMKYAMSLDGKIACATGDSKWVTGEAAREHVQKLRNRYMGIMVGIGTVLADDPMLTCRIPGGTNPTRIICDSSLRIPKDSRIVQTAREIPTIVACSSEVFQSERAKKKVELLNDAGIQILPTSGGVGINLIQLMEKLGGQGIDSILLEGGGTLNSSALRDGIVNKIYAYISNKLIGGVDAPTPIGGIGADHIAEAVQLTNVNIRAIEEDMCICGYPAYMDQGGNYVYRDH